VCRAQSRTAAAIAFVPTPSEGAGAGSVPPGIASDTTHSQNNARKMNNIVDPLRASSAAMPQGSHGSVEHPTKPGIAI
jgi:hypothetical protein